MDDFLDGRSPFLKRSHLPPEPLSSALHRSSLKGKALIGVVVYTESRGEVIRIISARKATKREARYYDQIIEN